MNLISGIHHITAIAGAPQTNLDFYSGILGLRLIKKTVNFDAPDVYHFYYGNSTGDPGTILTFFPYNESLHKGRHGNGQLNTTAFSVDLGSLSYWENRLKKYDIPYKPAQERLSNEVVIYFEDPDGLGLELVFSENDDRKGFAGHIPEEYSIKGFYNAEIWEESYERTASILTEVMDHKLISEKGNRFRYAAEDKPGCYVDILFATEALKGLGGRGSVHHIAFATPDGESQVKVREKVMARGMQPTPVIDRNYFTSVYFREPGGVLFEVATNGPGFMIDEQLEDLGQALKLPAQYEGYRAQIESSLTPVRFNSENFR